MKVAVAKYPIQAPGDFAAFADKQAQWLGEARARGAQLAVLPEYLSLELGATLGAGAVVVFDDRDDPPADARHNLIAEMRFACSAALERDALLDQIAARLGRVERARRAVESPGPCRRSICRVSHVERSLARPGHKAR